MNTVQSAVGEPQVTISLVTYRTPPTDVTTLISSLAASSRVSRILTIDNSPTGLLRESVQRAGGEYCHVPENVGFSEGHNRAISLLLPGSRYHLIVNPDITCEPQVVDSLYDFMEQNIDVGLAMPRVVFPDGREQRLCKLIPNPIDLFMRFALRSVDTSFLERRRDQYELRHLEMDVPREVPCLSGCFMFLRSSALRDVGLFDPRFFMYMEDVDLCRRVGEKYKTVFYPYVSVTHAYAKGSYSSLKLFGYHLTSGIRYFNKWGWIRDRARRNQNSRTALFSGNDPTQG